MHIDAPQPVPPTPGFLWRNRVYLGLAGLVFILLGLIRFLVWFAAQRKAVDG